MCLNYGRSAVGRRQEHSKPRLQEEIRRYVRTVISNGFEPNNSHPSYPSLELLANSVHTRQTTRNPRSGRFMLLLVS